MGPAGAFSWQAASEGQVAASRSSASMRWRWIGRRWPLRARGTTRERLRFHRHRAANMGWARTAWVRASSALRLGSIEGTWDSGKLCWGPSERETVSSSAAACSSKSKDTQKRFRSASPKARFTAPPNGAWMTSWVPSLSSKNRSITMRSCVGRVPSAARPAAR